MASWGDNRYPPFTGRYPPNNQPPQPYKVYDPRSQYAQPPVPGFYNSAVQQQRQPQFPVPTLPPPIPHILKPGGRGAPSPPVSAYRSPTRDMSGDLFFQSPPSFPKPQVPYAPPPIKQTVSAPAPPLPRKPDFHHQPPIPPKPSLTAPPGAFPTLDLYPQNVHAPADAFPQEQFSASPQGYPGASSTEAYKRQPDAPAPPPFGPGPSVDSRTQEEDELKYALERSRRDAEARRLREDEELARAMQESMEVESRRHTSESSALPAVQIPSHGLSPNLRLSPVPPSASHEPDLSIAPTASPSSYFPSLPSSSPAGLRKAQSSYSASPEAGPSSSPPPFVSPPSKPAQQIQDDEALARSLMEEEEREMRRRHEEEQAKESRRREEEERIREMKRRQEEEEQARELRRGQEEQTKRMREQEHAKVRRNTSAAPVVRENDANASGGDLPQYTEVVAGSTPTPSHQSPAPSQAHSPVSSLAVPIATHRDSSPAMPEPSVAAANGSLYRSVSATALPKPDAMADARTARSHSFTGSGSHSQATLPPLSHSSPKIPKSPSGHPLPSVQEASESSGSTSGVVAGGSSGSTQPPNQPPPLSVSTNQFVDPELLLGVSMGFVPPAISPKLTPMQGPMPNVVALPYGRFPPLHIKSRNWRSMLQLMARLSETQVEPSIEAQALVKTAMHLRVVVNFIKVHQNSNDWHVVLYMTIDVPPPADYRYKARNNIDPMLLPYSYTLSPAPTYLRDNSDGPMSKWYSIPSTAQTPFPTLPISFPDLATYLMNALEDSKSAAHDRSSGLNRLSKIVDTIYPNQNSSNDEEEERAGFTERFGRLFGRGNRTSRPANDERSNLVTPFYADSFGR